MTRKNKLQAKIKVYKDRRRKIQEKYFLKKVGTVVYYKEGYLDEVKSIKRMLSIWRKRIKRIEKHEHVVKNTSKLVCEFMGITGLYGTARKTDRDTMKAKRLFCKYAVDNIGYKWIWLVSDFVGGYHDYAGKLRREFAKSFKTNKENYQLWQDFKKFVKQKEDANNN